MTRWKNEGKTLKAAAMAASMDVKTARRYLRAGTLPGQMKKERTYRTHQDQFAHVWSEVEALLIEAPGLEALTIFGVLQEKYPGQFQDGQLRTLQRRIKIWRATRGSGREVYFRQEHRPGELCASDFTHMDGLNVTIAGRPFPHMIYHFVLPYSNWETGTVCHSESYESLLAGFQNALFRLGGVPRLHRTDRLSAAVNNLSNRQEFTKRYEALLAHYGITGQKINACKSNENGDVEQSHHRFKKFMEQMLLVRGSRDFCSREDYERFVMRLFEKKNTGREKRLGEELKELRPLPERRLEDCRKLLLRVGSASTINVAHVTYSVHSRLIGETVEIRLYADRVELWYAQRRIEEMPRQRVEKGHFIQYRHIIDWLVRKPGAFAGYRYRSDLFPTTNFRIAHDRLRESYPGIKADVEYLKILKLAADEGETGVDTALAALCGAQEFHSDMVRERIAAENPADRLMVLIDEPDLSVYDNLLNMAVAS